MSNSPVKRKFESENSDSDTLNCKKVKASAHIQNEQGVMADNKGKKENKGGASRTIETTDNNQDDSLYVPPGIKLLFQNLSSDIKNSQDSLSKRIDNLEKELECKIIEKISGLISATIKAEVDSLRSEYNSEVDSLKQKVSALEASFAEMVKNSGNLSDPIAALEERKKRVVIRNLPEDKNESRQTTLDKVNALIKDGCKLSDVTITSVERKSIKSKKPGLIIATCDNFEQKQKLMKAKSHLKNFQKYNKVYLENDYSQEIRTCDSNFRTLLKVMGKERQFRVAGGKVYPVNARNGN